MYSVDFGSFSTVILFTNSRNYFFVYQKLPSWCKAYCLLQARGQALCKGVRWSERRLEMGPGDWATAPPEKFDF